MRNKIILLFLLCVPLYAQNLLIVGIIGRFDPATGTSAKSFDAIYRYRKFSVTSQFENRDSWTIGTRGYFTRHVFYQSAIRRNRLTDLGSENNNAYRAQHPWVLQQGIGADFQLFPHERIIVSISPSVRLKTVQTGYVAAVNSYTDLGHHVVLRAQYIQSQLLANSHQIGLGVAFMFGRKK